MCDMGAWGTVLGWLGMVCVGVDMSFLDREGVWSLKKPILTDSKGKVNTQFY